jgi:hypothetical protein
VSGDGAFGQIRSMVYQRLPMYENRTEK